jgi:hypothetical protein
MREKRFFCSKLFFQPVLALPGKITISRQLGPTVSLPDVI